MSSDHQTTPTTDTEAPKETNKAPATEPSDSSNSNAIDVHALKERIIATNKLFKYLSDAKNELAAREAQIATLNTNLGLSIKNLQESDEKYKKSAEQVHKLETQLKAKSVQLDTLSETNKKLKSDLKTQADLAKRMGSSAAEFRIAKEQATKLTQENNQLKEALSKLQAEKDQLDEDAMETSINHNLTIESLQEEIQDLKSSLTTDDSAVVSLKTQLEMEQSKAAKANAHSKALEERLNQAHEQIKQLQHDKSKSSQISQANTESADHMKRVHAEQVASLKKQIQQLQAKLERKAAAAPVSATSQQQQPHPDLTKKYHKLQADYLFIKRTNAFLEQELRRALEKEAEQTGFMSDNEVENVIMEDVQLSPPKPVATAATAAAAAPAAPPPPPPVQKSPRASVARPTSPPPRREPLAKSRNPRKTHSQHQHQQVAPPASAEEVLLQQKSGLIAPAPQINTTKSVKKRKSLLEKFATSKNPSRVLERAASNPSALTVSKKRAYNEADSEDQTANATTTPVSEISASASKRTKPDYHLNHVIEGLFNNENERHLSPSMEELGEIVPNVLEEVQDCYARIKSVAVLTDTELVEFGHSGLQLPRSMDQREKLYAWFLVSLFKINRDEFNQFMLKLAKVILQCPPAKTPLNHKLIRLVRLFIVACKAQASFGRLGSLVYELFRTKAFHSSIIPIFLNAGIIWKESFMLQATQPQFTSLHNTLVSSIYFISCHSSSVKNMNSMYQQLARTFHWPSKPKPILECVQDAMTTLQSDYFKQLHTEDKDKFDLLAYNLVTSFELAFIVLDDWNQTYDVFIRTSLWPLLNAQVVDVVAMELLGVLAKLGISSDPLKPNKPGVVTLLNTFSTIIKLGEDIDPNEKHLQFAASKAMAAVAGSHRDYRKFLMSTHDI